MAREGGIIQWIKLRVDRSASNEAAQQAQQAARNMGGGMLGVLRGFARQAGEAISDGISGGVKKAAASLGTLVGTAASVGRSIGKSIGNGISAGASGIRSAVNKIGGDFLAPLTAFFAARGIKDFVADMWELGSAAAETDSKFKTTFGKEGSATVQAFIDKFGTLMGLNKTVAQEMTATAGAIVQGMGASKNASAQFSQRIVKLAGDLQSFHNVPIQETFNAIRAGMVGEQEPLRRFGIMLNAADVESRALIDTHKKHKDELTQLEKSQAAVNLMYERAGPALGDLERTQNSTANQARNLKSEYDNLKIEMAGRLLPVFAMLIDGVQHNKDSFITFGKALFTVGQFVAGVLYQAFDSVASILTGVVMGAISGVTLLWKEMEGGILSVVLAKEKFLRLFGGGSDAAVERAQKAINDNLREQDELQRQVNASAAMFRSGFSLDAFRKVNNAQAGTGQFDWSSISTQNNPAASSNQIAAARAEREAAKERRKEQQEERRREREQKAKERHEAAERAKTDREAKRRAEEHNQEIGKTIGLLERVNEKRGLESGLLDQANALEKDLNDQLSKVGANLERRLEIEDQLDRVHRLQEENDPNLKASQAAFRATATVMDNPKFAEDVEAIKTEWESVAIFLTDLADGWSNAWQDAFTLIIQDGGNAAQALRVLGKSMAASVLGALANLAKGKVSANTASAIEELAEAAASFAWGNVASGHAHLHSAAMHGLAAAAWGVLAGAAGAGAAAIGSGGGGSGGGSNVEQSGGRVGGDTADTANPKGPEVHIYMDPISPNDPEHQKVILNTARNGAERFGTEDSDVFYHRRTA
jgi:hypothetical protein